MRQNVTQRQFNVTVVDSIMGQGKTTFAINYMKAHPDRNFLYITPYLTEVKRIKENLPHFVEPKAMGGSKLNHIKELILYGNSIASTHSLLGRFDLETQSNLKTLEYTLILDEVADVIQEHTFATRANKEDFFKYYAYVDDKGYVRWNTELHPYETYDRGSNFYNEMILCQNGNLVYVNDKLLVWELPVNIFKAFREVIILTYMFNGSVQKPYFDVHNIPYKYASVRNGELIPYEPTDYATRQHLKSLINIYDDERYNAIGDDYFALSSSWLKANVKRTGKPTQVGERLKKNTELYFKYIAKTPSELNMWSTYDTYYPRLKGLRYGKKEINFVEFNTRATNDYQHKKSLAYLLNVFPHTSLVVYFNNREGLSELNIDRDAFALNTLLQWIWRSRIRRFDLPDEERKINLYLPSARMRNLLISWLDAEELL
jgi:hypothetical protein